MEPEECKIELKPDEKLGWKLEATEQCKTLLEDINRNQGPYSQKYLNRRVVIIDKEARQPASNDTHTE